MLTRLLSFSENQLNSDRGSVVARLSNILSASNRNNKPLALPARSFFDEL